MLGIVYLAIVWTLSALIRLLERRLALPERPGAMPDWAEPAARYMLSGACRTRCGSRRSPSSGAR